MKNNGITRREALQRMGLGLLGLSLLSTLPIGCSPRNKKSDQRLLCNKCNGCGQCQCPYGVDIAANLTLYNKMAEEGQLPDPREGLSEHYLLQSKEMIRQLNGIPRLAQADRCVTCLRCADSCPQQVDIPVALHQMEALIQKVKDDGTLNA